MWVGGIHMRSRSSIIRHHYGTQQTPEDGGRVHDQKFAQKRKKIKKVTRKKTKNKYSDKKKLVKKSII